MKNTIHVTTHDGEYSHVTSITTKATAQLINSATLRLGTTEIEFDCTIEKVEINNQQVFPAPKDKGPGRKLAPKPAVVKKVLVNIGLNRVVLNEKGKKAFIEHRNCVGVELHGVSGKKEDSEALHAAVKQFVATQCPGWALTGYVLPR